MTVRHIVVFNWITSASEEQKRAVRDGLSKLVADIPQVLSASFGDDIGVAEGNGDFALVADFADHDAYVAYEEHPAHVRFVQQVLLPVMAQRAAAQIELG